jgi:C-terminal processing protease CtpA/Prc
MPELFLPFRSNIFMSKTFRNKQTLNRNKLPVLLAMVLMSACHVFLGSDPDSSPKEIFNGIWNDFNETYALFDVRGIDWNEAYKTYSPEIRADTNSYRLFRVCAEMLDGLNDPHVKLTAPFGNSGSLEDSDDQEPLNLKNIQSRLKNQGVFAGDEMFLYGTFTSKPRVGYIYIKSFLSGKVELAYGPVQAWAEEIDGIVQSLADTDYIILDLRGNSGGLGSNAEHVAARFISVQKDYIKVSTKNGPGRNDFSAPVPYTIKPAARRYTKPIILLTDNRTVSAGERFTMALKTQEHVIHAGETTCGAFSAKIVRPVINGWEYSMSVQKVTGINGECYEGKGIAPDEEHRVTGQERQLNYALSFSF